MFGRTIRAKIVIWFTVIVTGILCVFSVLVYVNLKNNLSEDTDNLLELKAGDVIDSVDETWEEQKRQNPQRPESSVAFLAANSSNFVELAGRETGEIPVDPKLADISIGIFSVRGQRIASSEHAPAALSSRKALVWALAGKSCFENQGGARALAVPISEDGAIICILQVTKPLTFTYAALNKLKIAFFILIPVSLVLVSATGFLLAGIVVNPVSRIISAARHISAENLQSRIEVPDTDDEIRQLVDTFNQMLGKLETSFSAQKQIVQDISHELRTPLTIIKGEIEVALKKLRSQEEYKTALVSSLEEINKISRIVENLLVLARFDSHQMALEKRPVRLAQLLEVILADMRILAEAKHITVTANLDPGITVAADEVHLRRAVLNIIDNAIKYTPERGTVTVTLAKQAGRATITVTDTGIGIAETELPLIFGRFYRADSSRSSTGFGLGLSLSKAILEAHHGEIDVRSNPAGGATFILSLPQD